MSSPRRAEANIHPDDGQAVTLASLKIMDSRFRTECEVLVERLGVRDHIATRHPDRGRAWTRERAVASGRADKEVR